MIDSLLHSAFSFLPSPAKQDTAVEAVNEVLVTIFATICLVVICEVASYRTVQKLRGTPDGRSLHNSGISKTLFNFFVLGIPIHVSARLTVPSVEKTRDSTWESILVIAAFILLQNIAYYFAHMAMHTPSLYWMHRYHHRYNMYVTPTSANAVTISEFVFAYVMPPAFITSFLRPNEFEQKTAMLIISFSNILVHTPAIEAWSERNLPKWWVSTHVHSEHHRKITKNYASPCINLDYLLGGGTSEKVA